MKTALIEETDEKFLRESIPPAEMVAEGDPRSETSSRSK
jgi:hypothetical protein